MALHDFRRILTLSSGHDLAIELDTDNDIVLDHGYNYPFVLTAGEAKALCATLIDALEELDT